MAGHEHGPNAASRHAWLVFNRLLKPNADYAIDYHTSTTGMDMTAFIDAGIPAFTPEIGAPRKLDLAMIPLFVEGTMNVLKHHGIITGPMGRTGKDSEIFVGNSATGVLATHGGFVELMVKLNDKVEAGQKVAIQRNAFGEVVAEYTAPKAGEIAALRTDATSEPGNGLVSILYDNTPPVGGDTYTE